MLIKFLIVLFIVILLYQIYLAMFNRREGLDVMGSMTDALSTGITGAVDISSYTTGSTGSTGTVSGTSLYPSDTTNNTAGSDYSNYSGNNESQITHLTRQQKIDSDNIASNTNNINTLFSSLQALNGRVNSIWNSLPPGSVPSLTGTSTVPPTITSTSGQ
jgi:hypothetical protein